jgi:ankyrin repeat protein
MKSKILILLFTGLLLVNLSCKKKINPALNKPLLEAVRAGDLNKVKELVCGGADINADVDGYRPLVEAANKKHDEIVKYLLDEDADVNIQDKDGDTALTCASLRGSLEVTDLLIKKGAKIDIQNKQGKTALMYAIYGKHSGIVKHLLDKGANPILRDKKGNDPLSLAITVKKKAIIEAILENGAAVTMKHLKLAGKLYCKIKDALLSSEDHNYYPNLSKLLENPYFIKKDVDYKKYYKLIKTIVSYDKKRKAEVYDNGVIKIYDLKTGKFIKAFGGIQFIKKVLYPISNRLFIDKTVNLKVNLVKAYVGLKTGKWRARGFIDAFFLKKDVTLTFDVDKEKYYKFEAEYFNGYKYEISNTGRYFYTINYSSVTTVGFSTLSLYDLKEDNCIYSLFNPKMHPENVFGQKIHTYPYPLIGFSHNDKYMIIAFHAEAPNTFNNNAPLSAAMVLNIKTKKIVLKRFFSVEREKIKFSPNENALIITLESGRQQVIGLK